MSAKGWLFAAPRISARPNSNINPVTSFGIMPAPGADRLPNGRSPLNANTARPNRMNAAPATWSDLNVTNGTGAMSSQDRRPLSHLADLTDRFLGPLDVLVPEFRERGRREIARLKPDVGERLVELRAGRSLVDRRSERREDRSRGVLRRKQTDPEIVSHVVAEFLHRRHIG